MIEWFRKELDGTLSHCLNPHSGIAMSGNEDDWNPAVLSFELGLQFESRHLRHTDIRYYASGLTMQKRFEQLFRRSEALCLKAGGFD